MSDFAGKLTTFLRAALRRYGIFTLTLASSLILVLNHSDGAGRDSTFATLVLIWFGAFYCSAFFLSTPAGPREEFILSALERHGLRPRRVRVLNAISGLPSLTISNLFGNTFYIRKDLLANLTDPELEALIVWRFCFRYKGFKRWNSLLSLATVVLCFAWSFHLLSTFDFRAPLAFSVSIFGEVLFCHYHAKEREFENDLLVISKGISPLVLQSALDKFYYLDGFRFIRMNLTFRSQAMINPASRLEWKRNFWRLSFIMVLPLFFLALKAPRRDLFSLLGSEGTLTRGPASANSISGQWRFSRPKNELQQEFLISLTAMGEYSLRQQSVISGKIVTQGTSSGYWEADTSELKLVNLKDQEATFQIIEEGQDRMVLRDSKGVAWFGKKLR